MVFFFLSFEEKRPLSSTLSCAYFWKCHSALLSVGETFFILLSTDLRSVDETCSFSECYIGLRERSGIVSLCSLEWAQSACRQMASPVLSCLEIWEEDVAFTSVTEIQECMVVFIILVVVFLQWLQSVWRLALLCWNNFGLDLSGILLAFGRFVPSLRWSVREGDARLVCGCSSHS